MKRFVALLLAALLMLGLCACGNGASGETEGTPALQGFCMGYSKKSILNDEPVGLGGYANYDSRISAGFLDIPYTTCIAFSQDGTTVLLYTMDLCYTTEAWAASARYVISQATGVPENHIMFSGTHTHSAVQLTAPNSSNALGRYAQMLIDQSLAAAKEAIADLSTATVYGGKEDVVNANFIRHYIMNDGSYVIAGDASKDPEAITAHASETDRQLQVIKATREGKKDIVLFNWQCHPTLTSTEISKEISADFIAPIRDTMEKENGVLFAYFSGASGNQVANSYIPGEDDNLDYKKLGARVVEAGNKALANLTQISGSGIKTTQKIFEYPCNKYGQDRLAEAQIVQAEFQRLGSAAACKDIVAKYGFKSVYQCNGIVACSTKPSSDTMELNAFNLGGIGLVTAPYEMFSDSGLYIKGNSPFEFTIVCTQANGYLNYFPKAEAYDADVYETQTAHFAKGVAEATAEQFVELLKTVQ